MRMWVLFLAGVGLLLSGCGGATSDQPLSNEQDSVLDERLIGVWEPVPAKPEEASKPQRHIYVGRLRGSERALEVVMLEIDKEQHVDVQRFRAFATRLGTLTCASVTDGKGKDYLLLRYEIDAAGRLAVAALDEQRVVDAIRANKIAGRVKENPDYGKEPLEVRRYDEVRLTATTKALRAWMEQAPDTWEKPDSNVPLRKLEFGDEVGSK